MILSRKLIEKILPEFVKVSDDEFCNAIRSTGNELPKKDISYHPQLNNLVIAKLISFVPHPNSDHMSVCQVQIDKEGTIKTIVCGAQNLVAGKKVIAALAGAKLHDGRVIEEKELRGTVSQGMLCAYNELTPLNESFVAKDDAAGIMLFDDGEIGDTNVAEFLGLDDTIYNIEVPYSNRHDIEGALAFCQDIAAYFNWPFKFPEPNFPKKELSNEIKLDKSLCNGFILGKINNVDTNSSSWKTKGLLMNNCIKPLNSILDKLNYITLLTNVATAAYDATKIHDIEVSGAKKGETFIGFNGKEYELAPTDIVVKTNGKIISLAGILGDDNFGVNKNTKSAYIELANFKYTNIRKTSVKFDITTDAAKRNRKEIPNYITMAAGVLFSQMFADDLVGLKVEIEAKEQAHYKLDIDYISDIIGQKIEKEQAIKNLEALGFKVKGEEVYYPQWRNDLLGVPDLAEEIIKKIDLNKQLPEQPINSDGNFNHIKYTDYYFIMKSWDILTNNYFNEVLTYNLTTKEEAYKFNIFNYKNNVNVISSKPNRQMMRCSLIHQMLNVYKYNINRKNDLIPIFENEQIYQEGLESGINNLTLLTPAEYYLDNVNKSKIVFNVNGLKAVINEFVDLFNAKVEYKVVNNSEYFFDSETVSINYQNEIIGYIGRIKNSLLKDYSLTNQSIYCATINWDLLLKNFKEPNFISNKLEISPLMNLFKDMTFGVDKGKYLGDTMKKLENLDFLESYSIIDKFDKEGHSSYTIRFEFTNKENLSNDTITSWMNQVIEIMEKDGFKLNK